MALRKLTVRFYEEDLDLLRQAFPGGAGKLGTQQVIREVLHNWVNEKLRAPASGVKKPRNVRFPEGL